VSEVPAFQNNTINGCLRLVGTFLEADGHCLRELCGSSDIPKAKDQTCTNDSSWCFTKTTLTIEAQEARVHHTHERALALSNQKTSRCSIYEQEWVVWFGVVLKSVFRTQRSIWFVDAMEYSSQVIKGKTPLPPNNANRVFETFVYLTNRTSGHPTFPKFHSSGAGITDSIFTWIISKWPQSLDPLYQTVSNS
jgi:hypothetical protein